MKSLHTAIAFGFVLATLTGCSGAAMPPVTPGVAAKMHGHTPLHPADCPDPNDSAGGMTGDKPC